MIWLTFQDFPNRGAAAAAGRRAERQDWAYPSCDLGDVFIFDRKKWNFSRRPQYARHQPPNVNAEHNHSLLHTWPAYCSKPLRVIGILLIKITVTAIPKNHGRITRAHDSAGNVRIFGMAASCSRFALPTALPAKKTFKFWRNSCPSKPIHRDRRSPAS